MLRPTIVNSLFPVQKTPCGREAIIYYCYNLLPRTSLHTTKYIHQRDSPLVRLLGGEGMIPKSTQHVTVMTDTTQ